MKLKNKNSAKKLRAGFTVLILLAALLVFSGVLQHRNRAGDIIVYSGRREQFVRPILDEFQEQSGIRVRLLSGSATSLAHRLAEESPSPGADIFLANDAGVMEYLRLRGVFRPVNTEGVEKIPSEYRALDNSWVGLSARVRVLMYNRDLISEDEMPGSVFDMGDPSFRGRFALTRAGNASLISHMAAIRAAEGDDAMRNLIASVLRNDAIVTRGHTDIRRMVGSGEVDFGLVNCYYFRLQLAEGRFNNVGVIYPDQGGNEMGAFVNVAGAALVNGSPNPEKADRLMEFLLEEKQLQFFSELSGETPILDHLEQPEGGLAIGEFKAMDIPLSMLGGVWADTLRVMEEAGFSD